MMNFRWSQKCLFSCVRKAWSDNLIHQRFTRFTDLQTTLLIHYITKCKIIIVNNKLAKCSRFSNYDVKPISKCVWIFIIVFMQYFFITSNILLNVETAIKSALLGIESLKYCRTYIMVIYGVEIMKSYRPIYFSIRLMNKFTSLLINIV